MDNRISPSIVEALTRLLEYVEPDERADYETREECSEARWNHIYGDICFLLGWVRTLAVRQPRPIEGSRRESPDISSGPYSYARRKDGSNGVIEIHGPDGFLFSLPFWEKEPEAREAAKTVIQALNRFHAATAKVHGRK
jgi:hypothetical protein